MYINYEPNRFSAGLKSRLPFKAFNGLIDFDFWCFNATFSNILAISLRPVLVVEEAGIPREKFYKKFTKPGKPGANPRRIGDRLV